MKEIEEYAKGWLLYCSGGMRGCVGVGVVGVSDERYLQLC